MTLQCARTAYRWARLYPNKQNPERNLQTTWISNWVCSLAHDRRDTSIRVWFPKTSNWGFCLVLLPTNLFFVHKHQNFRSLILKSILENPMIQEHFRTFEHIFDRLFAKKSQQLHLLAMSRLWIGVFQIFFPPTLGRHVHDSIRPSRLCRARPKNEWFWSQCSESKLFTIHKSGLGGSAFGTQKDLKSRIRQN